MIRIITLLLLLNVITNFSYAQSPIWQRFTDSIPTLSSPRACDLNNDGVKDIVIGGGTDGVFSNNGIMAYNGVDGSLLWKRAARNEVFGSAIFMDANNDGTEDVFIVGRSAQLLCINGINGQLIWDYFPYGTNPVDSGLYNFYNPQFIPDINGDNLPDILVSNGGDHAAPVWQTNRPAGRLMVINAANGALLANAVVPDSAEIYCSPIVADIKNDGNKWVLYGTGGETLGGSFWACPLSQLLGNSLQNSTRLLQDSVKGFVAPASIFKTSNGSYDIIIQGFGGKIARFRGSDFTQLWSTMLPNTESSAAAVIGNFTGSLTPDVFAVLYKGTTNGGYTDFYQLMLDGDNGNIVFKDSIGNLHFASANAIDLNNDGRDEAVISVAAMNAGAFRHSLYSINFANANQISQIGSTQTGINLASTPLITDLTNNDSLEMVYVVKRDSLDPTGWKGIYVHRMPLNKAIPNAGIAWGSYMGSKHDGRYTYLPQPCAAGSVVLSTAQANPSCNGLNDGGIALNLSNPAATHTFLWSNGATSALVSGLTAGTYALRATNDAGCYEDLSVTLTEPFAISFGGISPVACPADTNGMATLSSTGCQCMFSTCTFLWENGVTTKPNTSLGSGWNYVTITHSNGCVVVDSVMIPINDNSLPVITAPANITVVADSGSCSVAGLSLGTPTSSDNCGIASVTNDANNLTVGTNTVTWTVTDVSGNTATATQLVTILDNEAPIITSCPTNISVNSNTANCAAIVSWTLPMASDNCTTPIMSSTHNNGDVFPLGITLVTYSFEDASGNTVSCSFNVEVLNSLSATAVSSDVINGNDGAIAVTMNGGTAPFSFSWTGPGSFSASTEDLSGLAAGNYDAQITDANGCSFSLSATVGTASAVHSTALTGFGLYPNPTVSVVNVKAPEMGNYLVEIYNQLGQQLLSESFYGEQKSFDLSKLSAGVYAFKISNKDNGRFENISVVKY